MKRSKVLLDSFISRMGAFHKFSAILFWATLGHAASITIVKTSTGDVEGKLVNDSLVTYYSFTGIPYAEPPIGVNRFLPPIPKKQWPGVFDATKLGPVCFQTPGTYALKEMTEDCLVLNVFVPANIQQPLPVIVFVHGGEFNANAGQIDYQYGPQFFLRRDVIFVTMNYRLGALGFLSVGTQEASGNAGIKDVLLALKWVKHNIAVFGGDPNNITLGGHSAGSVITQYLLLSKQSTGLINRAFLISGSALGCRFLSYNPLENAINLGQALGFKSDAKATTLIDSLRNSDAYDIILATQAMKNNDKRLAFRPFSPFVGCIEPESSHAIITEDPINIVRSGIPQNVPLLVGFNSREGLKMYTTWNNETLVKFLNDDHELIIPSNLRYPRNSDEAKKVATEIKQFYFGDGDISTDSTDALIDLVSDTQFMYSIDSWIKIHKNRIDSADLWYYVFDFDGELNWAKLTSNITLKGTAHADELGYFFVTKVTKNLKVNEDSLKVSSLLTELWSRFAWDGKLPDYWKKVTNGAQRRHLVLKVNPEMVDEDPFQERLSFWANLYKEYYKYIEDGGTLSENGIP